MDSEIKRIFFFHIGLHKTATTFLQHHVFPECKYLFYVERDKLRKKNREDLFKDWRISRDFEMGFSRSPVFWTEQGEKLIQNAVPVNILHGQKNVLISSEGITGARIFLRNTDPVRDPFCPVQDPHMLYPHFNNIRKIIKKYGFNKIRLILTIRRQDQWFASNYSQYSHIIPRASQRDFETQVNHMIDHRYRYYWEGIWGNLKLLRDCIRDIAGKDDYLILPYELLQTNPEAYLNKLSRFLSEPSLVHVESQVYNQNIIDNNVWKKKRRIYYLKPWRIFNKFDNTTIAVPFGFKGKIRVHEQFSEKILNFYSESNKQLDVDENLGLKDYGYY